MEIFLICDIRCFYFCTQLYAWPGIWASLTFLDTNSSEDVNDNDVCQMSSVLFNCHPPLSQIVCPTK